MWCIASLKTYWKPVFPIVITIEKKKLRFFKYLPEVLTKMQHIPSLLQALVMSYGDFFSAKKMSPCFKVHKKIADQPCNFLYEKDRTQILKQCMPVFTTYWEVLPDRYFFDFKFRGLVCITKKFFFLNCLQFFYIYWPCSFNNVMFP